MPTQVRTTQNAGIQSTGTRDAREAHWAGRSADAGLMRGVQSSAKLTRFFRFVKQEFSPYRQILCPTVCLLQYHDLIYDHNNTPRQSYDNVSGIEWEVEAGYLAFSCRFILFLRVPCDNAE